MDIEQLWKAMDECGADKNTLSERFVNDIALYYSCMADFLKDEAFDRLRKALEEGDYQKAFEAAHSLKGTSGNIYKNTKTALICRITGWQVRTVFY